MTREPGDLPVAVGPLRGRGVPGNRGLSSRDDRLGSCARNKSPCVVCPPRSRSPGSGPGEAHALQRFVSQGIPFSHSHRLRCAPKTPSSSPPHARSSSCRKSGRRSPSSTARPSGVASPTRWSICCATFRASPSRATAASAPPRPYLHPRRRERPDRCADRRREAERSVLAGRRLQLRQSARRQHRAHRSVARLAVGVVGQPGDRRRGEPHDRSNPPTSSAANARAEYGWRDTRELVGNVSQKFGPVSASVGVGRLPH